MASSRMSKRRRVDIEIHCETCRDFIMRRHEGAVLNYIEDLIRGDTPPVSLLDRMATDDMTARFLLEHSWTSVYLRYAARICYKRAKKYKVSIKEVVINSGDIPELFFDDDQRNVINDAITAARHTKLPTVKKLLDAIDREESFETVGALCEVLSNHPVIIYRAYHEQCSVLLKEMRVERCFWKDVVDITQTKVPPREVDVVVKCLSNFPIDGFIQLYKAGIVVDFIDKEPVCKSITTFVKNCKKEGKRPAICFPTTFVKNCNKKGKQSANCVCSNTITLLHLPCPDSLDVHWTDEMLDCLEEELKNIGVRFNHERPRCSHQQPNCLIRVGDNFDGTSEAERDFKEALLVGSWTLTRYHRPGTPFTCVEPVANGEVLVPHPLEWSSMTPEELSVCFTGDILGRAMATARAHKEMVDVGIVACVLFPSSTLSALGIRQKIIFSTAIAQKCRSLSAAECRQVVVGDFGRLDFGRGFPGAFPRARFDTEDIEALAERTGMSPSTLLTEWRKHFVAITDNDFERPMKSFVVVHDVPTHFRDHESREHIVLFPDGLGSATMEVFTQTLLYARTRCKKANHVFLSGKFAEAFSRSIVTSSETSVWYAQFKSHVAKFNSLLQEPDAIQDDDADSDSQLQDEDNSDDETICPQSLDLVRKLVNGEMIKKRDRLACFRVCADVEDMLGNLNLLETTHRGGIIVLEREARDTAEASNVFRLLCLTVHNVLTCDRFDERRAASRLRKVLYTKTKACASWLLRQLAHAQSIPVARQLSSVQVFPSLDSIEEALRDMSAVLSEEFDDDLLCGLKRMTRDPLWEKATKIQALIFYSLWTWTPGAASSHERRRFFTPLASQQIDVAEFLRQLRRRCRCAIVVATEIVNCDVNNAIQNMKLYVSRLESAAVDDSVVSLRSLLSDWR